MKKLNLTTHQGTEIALRMFKPETAIIYDIIKGDKK
jgi:hypothetical protein